MIQEAPEVLGKIAEVTMYRAEGVSGDTCTEHSQVPGFKSQQPIKVTVLEDKQSWINKKSIWRHSRPGWVMPVLWMNPLWHKVTQVRVLSLPK